MTMLPLNTFKDVKNLRDCQIITELMDCNHLNDRQSKLVMDCFGIVFHGKKQITFAQRERLNSYMWKVSQMEPKCKECGKELIPHIMYAGSDKGYVDYLVCSDFLQYDEIPNAVTGGTCLVNKCDYAEEQIKH